MPDRNGHDDVDAWLDSRIEPLPPPPGTFDAIRRRARRRKFRKLAVSAGAAVVVIAAAVTVPQVVRLPIENAKTEAGASSPSKSAGTSATSDAPGVQTSATAPIPLPTGNPVPPHFQPASITAVSETTSFTIGQAGTPGQCATQYCTSVARTQDAGGTWTGLPAPLTGAPDGATGVGQIRFLDGINGWAFGPELWATHDGGESWKRISTHGQRVIDVETVGARAFAIEATCTGTGEAFAAQCTSFTLYSAPARGNDWTKVGAATTGLTPAGAGSTTGAAALVLTGARGYLLGPGGTLYAGPVNGTAAWHAVGDIPCFTGQAQPDGEPAGALLGAVTAAKLLLACTQAPSGTTQTKLIYASSNGGKSWQEMWVPPTGGIATSIAASPAYTVVLATSVGIEVLPSQGGTWRPAVLSGAVPATGFSFVGMTTDTRGMALPADPAAGTVWFTTDGGLTWVPHAVQGS
jgi:photosystem II stability/assembly factor-like uncharacterized protein